MRTASVFYDVTEMDDNPFFEFVKNLECGFGGLDISYEDMQAFAKACYETGYSADALIEQGAYIQEQNGRITAEYYAENGDFESC